MAELVLAMVVAATLSAIAVPIYATLKENSIRRTLSSSAQAVATNANAQAGSAGRSDTTDEDIERAIGETDYAEFETGIGVSADVDPGDQLTWLSGTNRILYSTGSFCARVTITLQPDGDGHITAQAGSPEACSTTFDPPGTPTIAFNGTSAPTIAWTAPASVPDAAAVADYRIEYSTGSDWTTFTDAVSTATSAQITGLSAGPLYRFRVTAISDLGDSPTSGESAPLDLLPAVPAGVTLAATNTALAVTWAASATTTSWTAAASPGGASCTGTGTVCTITGLTTGTRYNVTVTATNAYGTSNPSAGVSRVPGSPANDDLVAATVVPYLTGGTSTTVTATFTGATVETGEPTSSYNRTVWWRYTNTSAVAQRLTVTFPGNTRADIYDSTTWTTRIVQALPAGGTTNALLVVRAGQTVSVRLDASWAAITAGFAAVDLPVWNDDIANAIAVPYLAGGTSTGYTADFTGATTETGEPVSSYNSTLWWKYVNTSAIAQHLTVTFPGNTRADIYNGATWATRILQSGPAGGTTNALLVVRAGQTVLVRLDRNGTLIGVSFATADLPAWNDNIDAAATVAYLAGGASTTATADFTGATTETGEPVSSYNSTLWWRYTNTGAVTQQLTVGFPGGVRFDGYKGATWATRVLQAGPAGGTRTAVFVVPAGQTVTVRLDGTGTLVGVTFATVDLPDWNDNIANAIAVPYLAGGTSTTYANRAFSGASVETGEPSSSYGNTLWWKYTNTSGVPQRITVTHGARNVRMDIYNSSSWTGLIVQTGDPTANVSFMVPAGQTVSVRLDSQGWGINVVFAAVDVADWNDNIANVTAVPYLTTGTSTSYSIPTFAGATVEAGEPSSSYNRTLWWRYTNTGGSSQRLTVSFARYTRVDVYNGSGWTGLITQAGDPASSLNFVAAAGQTVTIRVDGPTSALTLGFATSTP